MRRASPEDAAFLAPRLRAEDRREVLAATGQTPEDLLPGSLADALAALCVVSDEGEPFGIFGVHPVPGMPLVGAVWLLATPALERHTLPFLRQCRRWTEALHTVRPVLVNFADARNTVHVRWIEWCGFSLLARHAWGGTTFIEFAKVKPECVLPPP